MAIQKNDLILLLTDLGEKQNIDVSKQIRQVLKSNTIDLDVLKFINDNRQLDLAAFYENLRKNYNHKKSVLYINIVKEISEPNDVLVTLSAMLTQILLFSRKVSDRSMFLKHARAEEISKVLTNYFITWDLKPCIKLLQLVKADLKCLESIK